MCKSPKPSIIRPKYKELRYGEEKNHFTNFRSKFYNLGHLGAQIKVFFIKGRA